MHSPSFTLSIRTDPKESTRGRPQTPGGYPARTAILSSELGRRFPALGNVLLGAGMNIQPGWLLPAPWVAQTQASILLSLLRLSVYSKTLIVGRDQGGGQVGAVVRKERGRGALGAKEGESQERRPVLVIVPKVLRLWIPLCAFHRARDSSNTTKAVDQSI